MEEQHCTAFNFCSALCTLKVVPDISTLFAQPFIFVRHTHRGRTAQYQNATGCFSYRLKHVGRTVKLFFVLGVYLEFQPLERTYSTSRYKPLKLYSTHQCITMTRGNIYIYKYLSKMWCPRKSDVCILSQKNKTKNSYVYLNHANGFTSGLD